MHMGTRTEKNYLGMGPQIVHLLNWFTMFFLCFHRHSLLKLEDILIYTLF